MRMTVVLPAALGPSRPKIRPSFTWIETLFTAVSLLNRLVKLTALIIRIAVPGVIPVVIGSKHNDDSQLQQWYNTLTGIMVF